MVGYAVQCLRPQDGPKYQFVAKYCDIWVTIIPAAICVSSDTSLFREGPLCALDAIFRSQQRT